MKKNTYLVTGFASLLALTLLIVMNYSWPSTEYSINDVILENTILTSIEKGNFINSI